MVKILLSQRKFAPLFWCQFFSAFNDNFLKNALVALIVYRLASENASSLVQIAGAILIAPFFFLSGIGGEMADRFDKALVARRLKLAEIAVAAVAGLGFMLHSVPVLMAALGGFGIIAALFGPIKYGILPDHLKREELPAGNALIEGATFIAVLLGTIFGTKAATGDEAGWIVAGLMLVFALLCWVSSLFIPKTGEGAPGLKINPNILASTFGLIGSLRQDSRLWRGVLAASWFWLVGAVSLALLATLVRNRLGGDDNLYIACMIIFSVSIAIGSMLAAFLAHGRILLLPTVIGCVMMGAFALDLGLGTLNAVPSPTPLSPLAYFASAAGIRFGIGLAGLAIGGGLFIVPVFSAVQAWAGEDRRARVIAGNNVINAIFIVAGALGFSALQSQGFNESQLFVLLGVLSLVVSVACFVFLPFNAFSDLLSLVYRGIFRTEVKGADNLRNLSGPTIIALNHTSLLDAGLALSLLEREPVFAIDSAMAEKWWVKPLLKVTRALPLDPTKPIATRTLINTVKNGETLVIFPEGRLTVTGSLMKVYDGAGLIADKSDAQIIPVRIEGLDQTPFSYLRRDQIRRRWFPKVAVTVLEPTRLEIDPALRGKARRQAAGAALYQVMSDLVFRTTSMDRSVIQAVIDAAEEHGWRRIATEDPVTGKLSYSKLLTGARVLGEKIMPFAGEGEAIGVMLPNANGAAVTLLACMSAGRVPAMINFTAGAGNILAACKAARITTILTSRTFVEKGRLDGLVGEISKKVAVVHLEDLRATIGLLDKLNGLRQAGKPLVARGPDDRGAILFTSGSEGTPKGVVLSNRNMLANAAQAAARIDFGRTDKVFNVLPVFHSFGLTVGTILPLCSGVPVYMYPTPLHYRIIPELVYQTNATILFGTDTFLAGYARAANPYDLRSVRYVLAGAEPVKDSTRRTYAEKFGLRILEGYGVTETAPVLAINTPMFNKFGTVGRIMPGMEARLEPVPGIDEGGRLFVKGPNVMLGYLRTENPGVLERPPEGWHDTGDIVTIDAQGFIAIKGRAKRFAKIAGEMVSLAAVETLAAQLWPDRLSAVAAVPDARKGEKLILVTQQDGATRAAFQAFARSRNAADLMVPAEVIVVDKVPVLGSGKLDYAGVNTLVATLAKERQAAE